MCGIVGLFLKNPALEPQLGALLTDMLVTMSDRGPDSAGIAIYGDDKDEFVKLTLQSPDPDADFGGLLRQLSECCPGLAETDQRLRRLDTHAVLELPAASAAAVRRALQTLRPDIRIMSEGDVIEIFKEVGMPGDVARRFGLESMAGTHGVGHTRMATESAVTTLGAHPFSTGSDQCLVHNGSLSNHNVLRRKLQRDGLQFETDNDTEVAAAYLTWKMEQGSNLGQALESGLSDLDGFYTFVVGTKNGFGVLRDPIACKPAVLAETGDYVAFGSEYRALVSLPNILDAKVWEPEPATVYFWEH